MWIPIIRVYNIGCNNNAKGSPPKPTNNDIDAVKQCANGTNRNEQAMAFELVKPANWRRMKVA